MSTDVKALHQSHLEEFQTHSSPHVSHVVSITGETAGPELVFGGGVHGNERGGVVAAIAVIRAVKANILRLANGSVHFILGNPSAYADAVRYKEQDLNRQFIPGRDPNSLEARRAADVMGYIGSLSRLAAIVDFHSVSTGNNRIGIFNREHRQNEALVASLPRVFDMQFAYLPEHLDGIFSEYAAHVGKEGFSIECGGHDDPLASEIALLTMKNVMENYGLSFTGQFPGKRIDPAELNRDPVKYKTIAAIRPKPGFKFIDSEVTTGKAVKDGEIYATSDEGNYIAPCDCVIVMPTRQPGKNDSDAGFLCLQS